MQVCTEHQEEQKAMLGSLTGGVNHKIKNLLTEIQTWAEVLGYDDLDPHDRQKCHAMHDVAIATHVVSISSNENRPESRKDRDFQVKIKNVLKQ